MSAGQQKAIQAAVELLGRRAGILYEELLASGREVDIVDERLIVRGAALDDYLRERIRGAKPYLMKMMREAADETIVVIDNAIGGSEDDYSC